MLVKSHLSRRIGLGALHPLALDRIATPHLKMDFVEEERQVRISDTADIEAVPGTGERRSSRDRIPTPFIKEK